MIRKKSLNIIFYFILLEIVNYTVDYLVDSGMKKNQLRTVPPFVIAHMFCA